MGERLDDLDLDAAIHRALSSYLPDGEPPIGIRVDELLRLARRRYRARRLAFPIVAAVITVLALAMPLSVTTPARTPGPGSQNTTTTSPTGGTTNPGAPAPGTSAQHPPLTIGVLPPPPQQTNPPAGSPGTTGPTGSSAPSSQTSQPQQPQPEIRLPAGHHRDAAADALADYGAGSLPAGADANHFGSASDQQAGGRWGYGFHYLWQQNGGYGYLMVLHRTWGTFPAATYGLPVEPCAEPDARLAAYNCAPYPAPNGDPAYSFELSQDGYRMRGIVWEKRYPGEPDIRVTSVFYIPATGAWTPFSVLDTAQRIRSIPVTLQDLARYAGMP